jgi:hypothetical protein
MLVAVKKMGIINIRNHLVLLVKFPHKFYNTLDLPWVQLTWQKMYSNGKPPHERKCVDSFWWKDIISFAPNFLLMTRCRVNNGLSVSSWNDHWDLGVVNALYTQLVSFARKKGCSVSQFLAWEDSRHFFLALPQTFYQFTELKEAISALHLQPQENDAWTYPSNGLFSSHKVYCFLQGSLPTSLLFKRDVGF